MRINKPQKQTLVLTAELRQELKRPLGMLIKGTPDRTMKELGGLLSEKKPSCIVSVGDMVSRNMLEHGIQPNLIIVDSKIMRANVERLETSYRMKMKVANSAGTLAPETWGVVSKALKKKQPVELFVDGEEDLLTLVAVLESPEEALVVYGQPSEGIVVVKVDKIVRERVLRIVKAMESHPKA